MRTIATWIDISAPPAQVWRVLADFAAYPKWNPFITSIGGELREAATLRIQIQPPGQSALRFKPKIQVLVPGQQLIWLGHVLVPGLFDGRHELRLEERGGQTRFHHCEQFSGILVTLFGAKLLAATELGFAAMNRALKQRVEAPPQ